MVDFDKLGLRQDTALSALVGCEFNVHCAIHWYLQACTHNAFTSKAVVIRMSLACLKGLFCNIPSAACSFHIKKQVVDPIARKVGLTGMGRLF